MSKPLVIVESPTKIKTLKKIIGNDFNIAATAGHIKDLPPKEIGIDVEKGFKAKYLHIKGKSRVIKELKAAAGNATDIYLAPDLRAGLHVPVLRSVHKILLQGQIPDHP